MFRASLRTPTENPPRRRVSRRVPAAFSLLELMVAVGLFSIVLLLVFAFFTFGTRSFQTAVAKQGIQTDATRVMTSLHADLKRSSRPTVSHLNRTSGDGLARDAIVMGSLRDWRDLTDEFNFDPATGQPRWNRYMVYYATSDTTPGRLVREVVDPSLPPVAPVPLPDGDIPGLVRDDPNLNQYEGDTPPYTVLAHNVARFDAEPVGETQFRVILELREKGAPNAVGQREDEVFEIVLNVYPENTYPPEE